MCAGRCAFCGGDRTGDACCGHMLWDVWCVTGMMCVHVACVLSSVHQVVQGVYGCVVIIIVLCEMCCVNGLDASL